MGEEWVENVSVGPIYTKKLPWGNMESGDLQDVLDGGKQNSQSFFRAGADCGVRTEWSHEANGKYFKIEALLFSAEQSTDGEGENSD